MLLSKVHICTLVVRKYYLRVPAIAYPIVRACVRWGAAASKHHQIHTSTANPGLNVGWSWKKAIVDSDFPLFGAFAASAPSGQFLLWEDNRVKISMDGLMHGKNPGWRRYGTRTKEHYISAQGVMVPIINRPFFHWIVSKFMERGSSRMPITNHNCRLGDLLLLVRTEGLVASCAWYGVRLDTC